jgi:hypothetical protein
MPIDQTQIAALDEYSREFAERAFKAYPAWREFAWAEVEEGEEEPFLVIQFEAPSERGFDLELSTYAGEATLSSHFWHAHASTLSGLENPTGIEDENEAVIALTARLLGDQVRLYTRFDQGEFHSSGLLDSDAAELALEHSLPAEAWVQIRSHSGRLGRDRGRGPKPEEFSE